MRVILAWELGGNAGHARRLRRVAEVLMARGHEVHLVVQDLTALRLDGAGLWQAPIWGGLLRFGLVQGLGAPQRHGDVLANLGLQSASALEALLTGWETLFAAIRPEALVADFAPAALLAARGRIPRLATGTGFTVPPAHLPSFPAFGTEPPVVEEATLLTLVNHALTRLGRPPLSCLPDIAAAEILMPAVFAELDPYGAHRQDQVSPFVPPEVLTARPGGGQGVFAYLPGRDLPEPVLSHLARLGPRVTAHLPGLERAQLARLGGAGVRLLAQPLTWDRIAAHGRVICNGGMGMVSAALIVGLPLTVLPLGVEQRLTAESLQRHGLTFDPDRLESQGAAADRARSFRARMTDPALTLARALEGLVG